MPSYNDLKSLTKKELQTALQERKNKLLTSRMTISTKHEKDTSKMKKGRKEIAQIKTALREIELEEMVNNSNKID